MLLTGEIVDFLAGPNSTMVAGAGTDGVPVLARAFALVATGGDTVMVAVQPSTAGALLAALGAHPRVAIVSGLPRTHRTLQLKGRVRAIRATRDDERPAIDRALAGYRTSLAEVGLPERLTERVLRWPLTSIEVEVEELFEQSPGPGAGERLPPGAA